MCNNCNEFLDREYKGQPMQYCPMCGEHLKIVGLRNLIYNEDYSIFDSKMHKILSHLFEIFRMDCRLSINEVGIENGLVQQEVMKRMHHDKVVINGQSFILSDGMKIISENIGRVSGYIMNIDNYKQ